MSEGFRLFILHLWKHVLKPFESSSLTKHENLSPIINSVPLISQTSQISIISLFSSSQGEKRLCLFCTRESVIQTTEIKRYSGTHIARVRADYAVRASCAVHVATGTPPGHVSLFGFAHEGRWGHHMLFAALFRLCKSHWKSVSGKIWNVKDKSMKLQSDEICESLLSPQWKMFISLTTDWWSLSLRLNIARELVGKQNSIFTIIVIN